jgi:hypothetical protein
MRRVSTYATTVQRKDTQKEELNLSSLVLQVAALARRLSPTAATTQTHHRYYSGLPKVVGLREQRRQTFLLSSPRLPTMTTHFWLLPWMDQPTPWSHLTSSLRARAPSWQASPPLFGVTVTFVFHAAKIGIRIGEVLIQPSLVEFRPVPALVTSSARAESGTRVGHTTPSEGSPAMQAVVGGCQRHPAWFTSLAC